MKQKPKVLAAADFRVASIRAARQLLRGLAHRALVQARAPA